MVPAIAQVSKGRGGAQARADRRWCREPAFAQAVVDPSGAEVQFLQFARELQDERQREEAVRDGHAERPVCCSHRVYADPLVVAGLLGERGSDR
jgi:hypothetical protein